MIGHEFPYLDTRDLNLDWLLKNMKQLIQDWATYQQTMNQKFDNLEAAFNALHAWVDNYFDNLNVQQEINNKIDDMRESGELADVLHPLITSDVTDWLSEHITNPSNPPIDTSLSVSGAAADAKITGDMIRAALTLESNNATTIPANSNLDDYTTPGNFKVVSIPVAETIDNIPYATSGRLIVARTTQSDRIMQIYICNSAGIYIYYRMFISTWRSWQQFVNAEKLSEDIATAKAQTLAACWGLVSDNNTIIPANSDLNTYTTPGNYRVQTIAIAETISNMPYEISGCLKVMQTSQSSLLAQIYICNAAPLAIYFRFYNNTWGTWKRFADRDDVVSKITEAADVYFYGVNRFPTFVTNSDYSIDVTIPQFSRVNYFDLGDSPAIRCGSSSNIAAETINVPHDKMLIYDNSTKTVSVENPTLAFDVNKTVLFYNSHGVPNGTWYRYYLRQMLSEKADQGYPVYYEGHVISKAKQINLQLAALTSGDAFVFITDVHYESNALHSPEIVNDICARTGITRIHLNGDQITRENDKATALMQINRINNLFRFVDKETYMTVGNHEYNNPTASDDPEQLAKQVNPPEMKFAFENPMQGMVTFDTNTISYYYDNTAEKIRYVVGCVSRGSAVLTDSAKFIAASMASAPEGYGLVVIIHTLLGYTKTGDVYVPFVQNSTGATIIINAVDAARAGTTYTYGGVTYDYSNKNYEMLGVFCGDTHVDLFLRTEGGVPIICTTTDSFQEDGGLTRTSGTITEQAFDTVVIDRGAGKIYCNRIGAGSDRTFDIVAS